MGPRPRPVASRRTRPDLGGYQRRGRQRLSVRCATPRSRTELPICALAVTLPSGQHGVMDEALATRLRTAFNARDIDALRSLLAEGATWGEDPDVEPYC